MPDTRKRQCQNAEELAEMVIDFPEHVACWMQRRARFRGEHPTANLLNHSLEVSWRLREHGTNVAMCGLVHDMHELLTIDWSRANGEKPLWLTNLQASIDEVLHAQFALQVTPLVLRVVDRIDDEVNNDEWHYWDAVQYHYADSDQVEVFCHIAGRLGR